MVRVKLRRWVNGSWRWSVKYVKIPIFLSLGSYIYILFLGLINWDIFPFMDRRILLLCTWREPGSMVG
jgi:hypothetical protein